MTTYFISQAYTYIQVEVTEEAFTFHLCKADLHLPLQHTLTDLCPAEMKDDYDSSGLGCFLCSTVVEQKCCRDK